MLDRVAKIVAIAGTLSSLLLAWLYFGTDTRNLSQERMAAALEAIVERPDAFIGNEEAAKRTLSQLGEAARSVDTAARAKGFTDLPPVLITEDPVWVERYKSANWTLAGVGQVSIGVNALMVAALGSKLQGRNPTFSRARNTQLMAAIVSSFLRPWTRQTCGRGSA